MGAAVLPIMVAAIAISAAPMGKREIGNKECTNDQEFH